MRHENNLLGVRPMCGRCRGNIVVYLLVVLMVLVMGVVVSTASVSAVQAQISGLQYKRDQVGCAAETGIQRAFYEVEYGSWQSTTTYPQLTGTVGNCQYAVTAAGGGWNTPVVVTSVGTYTSDSTVDCTIRVTLSPKNLIPAINLGSGIQENGNLTIDGNALVKGNINLGGRVAIDGTLIYGGVNNGESNANFQWANPATIPSPPSVWYDASGTLTPPANVINVSPMVKSGSGARWCFRSSSPSTLDFRTTSNGVLYYFGDVSLKNVTVYGSGTLVVFGNLTVQNGGFGDSLDPVNLVTTGTLSTQAGFRIYGSIYANGDITHQGQFDVTGTVNAQGSMYPTNGKGAGGATINRAPTPAFDPRTTVGSGRALYLAQISAVPDFKIRLAAHEMAWLHPAFPEQGRAWAGWVSVWGFVGDLVGFGLKTCQREWGMDGCTDLSDSFDGKLWSSTCVVAMVVVPPPGATLPAEPAVSCWRSSGMH